jgi:aspartate dehydrogenase
VECGGHGAVGQYGAACLERGWNLVVGSVGALADRTLHDQLLRAARRSSGAVWIPAGAIAGIDALVAARRGSLDRVRYTSRKPPAAWKRTHADTLVEVDRLLEATEFMRTDARQAALLFPQNANVAATVALAGVGFERTEVSLNADPAIEGNVHLLEAWGTFGQMRVEMRNKAFPDNPKTSMLAGLSLLQAVLDRSSALRL